jgi:hypothetical protein
MSHKASKQGIKLAKKALIKKELTKEIIINRLACSRQPVYKFFNGQSISSEL